MRPLLFSPAKTMEWEERHIFLNQFPMRCNLPLTCHPHLLPQIAQWFFRQDVTMQTAPQRPMSSMAHSLLMLGNSAQQQGALGCLGIPTAAAISVELSNKTIFRFSTTAPWGGRAGCCCWVDSSTKQSPDAKILWDGVGQLYRLEAKVQNERAADKCPASPTSVYWHTPGIWTARSPWLCVHKAVHHPRLRRREAWPGFQRKWGEDSCLLNS